MRNLLGTAFLAVTLAACSTETGGDPQTANVTFNADQRLLSAEFDPNVFSERDRRIQLSTLCADRDVASVTEQPNPNTNRIRTTIICSEGFAENYAFGSITRLSADRFQHRMSVRI